MLKECRWHRDARHPLRRRTRRRDRPAPRARTPGARQVVSMPGMTRGGRWSHRDASARHSSRASRAGPSERHRDLTDFLVLLRISVFARHVRARATSFLVNPALDGRGTPRPVGRYATVRAIGSVRAIRSPRPRWRRRSRTPRKQPAHSDCGQVSLSGLPHSFQPCHGT